MPDGSAEIQWAPRVRQEDIRRLYETDAQGIYDEELIDEVGWALYARCNSFIVAVEASQGRAKCPRCGQMIAHEHDKEQVLLCSGCSWQTTWGAYFKSLQHKQLSGAEPVLAVFRDYMERFPVATPPQDKMLLIDGLIHSFHQSLRGDPTRTTAVNLIEGRYLDVVEFLDRLTYGERSTPGLQETRATWRTRIARTAEDWNNERLWRIVNEPE
jgi:ribosomal protein L37AE/L43A